MGQTVATEPDPAWKERLRARSEGLGLSVRTVSGMMTGVASSLGEVVERVGGYERAIETVHHSSTTLGTEMGEFVRLAQQVEGVLRLIEHIALQTRVLALNATLEAARAGETGRGFKVVAGSVKELAQQTSAATLDIREALSGILTAAERARRHGGALDEAIEAVRCLTHGMMERIQEQASVATAAAGYVEQAAAGVDAIADRLAPSQTDDVGWRP